MPRARRLTAVIQDLAAVSAQIEALSKELDYHANALEAEPLAKIATGFFMLDVGYKGLDDARKKVYHVLDFMDKTLVPKAFEREELDSVRVPEIARSFNLSKQRTASMLDKPRGFEWLRDNGLGELVTETVNAQTLAKALSEYIAEKAKDPPEDIFKYSTYYTVGHRAYSPK